MKHCLCAAVLGLPTLLFGGGYRDEPAAIFIWARGYIMLDVRRHDSTLFTLPFLLPRTA